MEYFDKGYILYREGKINETLGYSDQAVGLDPKNAHFYSQKGTFFLILKKEKKTSRSSFLLFSSNSSKSKLEVFEKKI